MNSKEPCLGSAFSQVSPKMVELGGLVFHYIIAILCTVTPHSTPQNLTTQIRAAACFIARGRGWMSQVLTPTKCRKFKFLLNWHISDGAELVPLAAIFSRFSLRCVLQYGRVGVRVQVGGPTWTVDRTETSRATFSLARPAKKLSSGIGTVYRIRASPGMTIISLTKDSMKALRSVNSLSSRKSLMS